MAHPSFHSRRVWSISLVAAVVSIVSLSVGIGPDDALAATGGTQEWAKRYDGPASGFDAAHSIAVSPDGSRVFITGESYSAKTGYDYATVAYDAVSGAALWSKRYDGPGKRDDAAYAIGVSPDGSQVFVTGQSSGSTSLADYATVAYDAATGARSWVVRYNGPGNGYDYAHALSVSPDGSAVFVTGESDGLTSRNDATIAYDASTGAKRWVKRFGDYASASTLGVSPDGSTVFVAGQSIGLSHYPDFSTVAYDAASGARLWSKRYNGPGDANDIAGSLGVSPDGSAVFVTGESDGSTSGRDYATVAYDTASGARLWLRRYSGPGDNYDRPSALGVSPDGSGVFVTGSRTGSTGLTDYATIGYEAATGATLWSKLYGGTGNDGDAGYALGVSPDGTKVFVTGGSIGSTTVDDYATLAYDATTGAKLWGSRYDGPVSSSDDALALGVSPLGSRVFVTGESTSSTGKDYATVAYNAG